MAFNYMLPHRSMTSLSELQTEEEFEQWGILDAIRQTEVRQQLPKDAGRFEFITKDSKREVLYSTCTLQEFALTKHVMQLVSRPNTATYLLETVNYKSASKDFKNFINFIEEYPEPGKSELSTLVFPIFVYFYLLLLESGPSGHLAARSFFKKNKDIFTHEESYDSVLETLHSFSNWKDVKEDPYYKNFLEFKYIIGISPDVLCALREFIESQAEDEGDKALLYVLHFHIHFQDNDEAEYTDNVSGKLPASEKSDPESMEQEAAKPVPDSTSAEVSTCTATENGENEDTMLESVSQSEVVDDELEASPEKNIECDSQSRKYDDDLIIDCELETLNKDLKELSINDPQISTVVTKCDAADISSVDFSHYETEIAYALRSYIYVVPLGINKEQTDSPLSENLDDEAQKRPRLEEDKMEIVLSTPSPSQKKRFSEKGAKSHKTRSVKSSKRTRKAKSATAAFINEDELSEDRDVDETPPLVRDIREIKVPQGETVYIVKYLPGQPHLLLAVCDRKVRLLNTETENFEAEYDINNGAIFDIDVNSTSQYFATANMDLVSCLYSFDMDIEIRSFAGHLRPVTAVKFHPNGVYIATGSDDFTVRMYDIESGWCIRRFSDHLSVIVDISFSPDGQLLASGDSLGAVKVWDIKSGSEVSEVRFSTEIETLARITSLCFHSDSSALLACNSKGECKLWDVRNPENLQRLNFTNIPLKVKFCKNQVWKIAFQHVPL